MTIQKSLLANIIKFLPNEGAFLAIIRPIKNLSKENESKLPNDCPLDKLALGKKTWSFLHTMAAYYPEKPTPKQQADMKSFIHLFSWFYPCSHCASDLRDE